MLPPFSPVDDATTTISASTSTAAGAIKQQPSGKHQLRLYNATGQRAFYALGSSAVTAAITDVPIPDGVIEVITVENADAARLTHLAVILASGSGSFYISTGRGI